MQRTSWIVAVLAISITGSITSDASAGWHQFWQRVKLDWHRNNAWPQPFVAQDRLATCSVFVTMAENGWRRQSTLSSLHFNPETSLLTEAGEHRVRQIVTQHPEQHRTVFVATGVDDERTAIRIDSVQQAIARILAEGPLPEVRQWAIEPRAWPAEEIDAVGRQYHASIPAPRLPTSDGGSQ